jgi:hypothetical protein
LQYARAGWHTYKAPFNLTGFKDGAYTIEYNSTDNIGNVETTHAITITLFSWKYIYEDTYGRGTILKINTAYELFQFAGPSKDYGIRKASSMRSYGTAITIDHHDSQLRMFAVAMGAQADFCMAVAWDMQTHTSYTLIARALKLPGYQKITLNLAISSEKRKRWV